MLSVSVVKQAPSSWRDVNSVADIEEGEINDDCDTSQSLKCLVAL